MSLRQKLLERSKVAGCVYQQTQLRNFPEISATAIASTAQLDAVNPHEIRVLSATAPQVMSCNGIQKHPPKVVPGSVPVSTVADPHYDLGRRLDAAVNRCCDYWGESLELRAQMLESLRSMPQRWQQGWIEHFEASYGQFKYGEGGGGYLSPPPFDSGVPSAR